MDKLLETWTALQPTPEFVSLGGALQPDWYTELNDTSTPDHFMLELVHEQLPVINTALDVKLGKPSRIVAFNNAQGVVAMSRIRQSKLY